MTNGTPRIRDRIASVAKEGGRLYLTPRRFLAEGNFVLVLTEGDSPPGLLRSMICFGSRTER